MSRLIEFGGDHFSPPVIADSVEELCESVNWKVEQFFAPRIRRMLDQWHGRGIWALDLTKPKRAPIRSTGAKPMSES